MAKAFCKHYRGMHLKDKCEAGVAFDALPNYGTKLFHDSCPCFGSENAANCQSSVYPTAEELIARDAELIERFSNMSQAREAIVAHLGGPWKRGTPSGAGSIDCPICGGVLQFSRAGYNGHTHAKCNTEGCVSWKE